MEIAALVPTLYRPAGLTRVLNSLKKTSPNVALVVAAEADDAEGIRIAESFGARVAVCQQPRAGCAYAWNTALAAAPDYDAYVIASDDVEFLPGWLELAIDGIRQVKGDGLVGLYAAWKQSDYSFFYLMTRGFIVQHHGGVAAVPHYRTWGVDTEACDRAKRAGRYYKTTKQAVIHHHSGNPPHDIIQATKKIYLARFASGMKDDFEPIIK